MGHIHLSFEYHVHKSTLKLRVWQLSDLLLPPPQISMIQSLYVRSYLIPASGKKTFTRTEEVRVENLEAHINVKPQEQNPVTGIQHIFTPSNFKFFTPMVYTNISMDVVRDQSLQIEVCMIQKTSRKSFLIGMLNIPLKKAIKKVVREKIPLIPCLNYTTPNNMRVYSAMDLELDGNGDSFYTSPFLRYVADGLSENNHSVGGVIVPDDNLIKPVHIMNIRQKNHNNNNIVPPEIKVHKSEESVSVTEQDIPVTEVSSQKLNGEISGEESDIDEVVIAKEPSPTVKKVMEEVKMEPRIPGDKKLIKVNMDNLEIKDVIASANQLKVTQAEPNQPAKIQKKQVEDKNGVESPKIKNRIKLSVPSDIEISDAELEADLSENVTSPVASRPETPVWDYYDFDYEAGTKPKSKESKSSTSSNKSNTTAST